MNVRESGVAAARRDIAKLLASLGGAEHRRNLHRDTGAIGTLKRTQKALDELRTIITLQILLLVAAAFLWSRFG